jgi:hypothetical protein
MMTVVLLSFACGSLLGATIFCLGRWSMRREMLRSGYSRPLRRGPAQQVFAELRAQERAEGKG